MLDVQHVIMMEHIKFCKSEYYKGNDNKCYKCIIDGYLEYNNDGTCNYCNRWIL